MATRTRAYIPFFRVKLKYLFRIFVYFFSLFLFLFLLDEFRSKVACENDVIQLVCNPYSRIAIYSAKFGRTEYESIQCAQPLGVMEESKYTMPATQLKSHSLTGKEESVHLLSFAYKGIYVKHQTNFKVKKKLVMRAGFMRIYSGIPNYIDKLGLD